MIVSKTGAGKVSSALMGINVPAFLLAILIYIISIFISSARWRLFLPEGFKMKKLFSLYMIGSFFNNILPGVIGGDAVKAYYLNNELKNNINLLPGTQHSHLTTAIASVFMDRYIGFAAMMSIGLTAFPFGFIYFRGSYIEWVLPAIASLFVIGSFLLFGLRIGRRVRFISDFYDFFVNYKKRKKILMKAFLLSVLVQIPGILSVYTLSLGLKTDVPLLPLFIFIPIISTISTLPISISGLGVREASFVLLLGFLGITAEQATAISFSWFLSIAAGSLPGLLEYLRYRKKRESAKIHNQNSAK